MIYITGDTHNNFGRFTNRMLAVKKLDLTPQDYVIVCGDLGLCWEEGRTFDYDCRFFETRPFTLLWVQGNHENYDMIEKFPIEEWKGGLVRHIVRDKVILLERGQVFELEGKRIFTFGGAASHDVQGGILDKSSPEFRIELKRTWASGLPFRVIHESWWPQELPSKKEMFDGLKNLAKVDNKVDYIISHCCATSLQNSLAQEKEREYVPDVLTDYFDNIESNVQYKHWFFGHYHDDKRIDDRHTLLYKHIIPLEDVLVDLPNLPRVGHPVYKQGDIVTFLFRDKSRTGKISVVDAHGIYGQSEEPSYDIFDENSGLYKHILESEIVGKVEDKALL